MVRLSGFLGSGRTTLVNTLLRDPAIVCTAVAVTECGEIPLGFFDGSGASVPRVRERPRGFAALADHVADPDDLGESGAVSWLAGRALRWHAFAAWLRDLRLTQASKLLRVNGSLSISATAGPPPIDWVGHLQEAPVAMDRWPDRDRRSRLVLIARSLSGAAVRGRWERALLDLLAAQEP